MSMKLKVVLPTGEVSVPVEPNSTPGHLKENLKYSVRLPPKYISLKCEGNELDDIKPLAGPPNNLVDGSTVVCSVKEGHEVEAAEAAAAAEAEAKKQAQPTMIKKEEPPKKKKVTAKDAVRPTLAAGDLTKKDTVSPGYKGWAPTSAFLEAKSKKRHLAFLKVEAVDEKKSYPEQDDGSIVFAIGDPHTSPVWTEAVKQMEIGEKANFTMSRKAVDYDPEGILPNDSCTTWTVELVRVLDVEDVNQDYSCLVHVDNIGSKDKAEELDRAMVHWRIRRWMAEGMFCIASSRERIAIMPGYGLVPIEDMNAPPVGVSVGEGQQEAVEELVQRVGVGGKGSVYLKSDCLKGNRPAGCVVFDVELAGIEQVRGPGSPGWQGWQTLIAERETGDEWLQEADGRRKQLETFGTMRKSTDDSKEAEEHVSKQVHKFAANAARRYRRALRWVEKENNEDKKIKLESATLRMRLAKATALSEQRFGDALEKKEASEAEKKALGEAKELLGQVLKMAQEMKDEKLVVECLRLTLQVHIQGEEVKEAKVTLEKLQTLKPGDEELKSDSARLNRMEQAMAVKKGSGTVEELQLELRAANEAQEFAKIEECLGKILELMKTDQVKFNTIRDLKVGKDVGNAMKLGNPDVAKSARVVVGEIQALAQRNAMLG
eukprot:TRINITY_DN74959_c0_g1_i1.p1 TRINITY_DN74959_c0_g1~~TRINITY_DN74959_c0_g1_i1.p1  ORF type:complete len:658 (+),score=240.12 TRINITY_DN74959_c0_g1_i1:121-2094(+)